MSINDTFYFMIDAKKYQPLAKQLEPKLTCLEGNRVTFKNEIHRRSRFAICHYMIKSNKDGYVLDYDESQSLIASNQKKTYSPPDILNNSTVKEVLNYFLSDINDTSISRAEVKLIQTDEFPFEFNPHRDSQFRRLRNIKYLATMIVSASDITGGNMQLFHSSNDKLGPFQLIEELPTEPGIGYVVDERPRHVLHGMKPAYKTNKNAHRGALLIRFFE
jgi:hypothetical protein